jgi:hypothetical protein
MLGMGGLLVSKRKGNVMLNTYHAEIQAYLTNEALHYAHADRSDPFAFSRALTHLKSGIASYRPDIDDDRRLVLSSYSASPAQETRKLPEGKKFSDGTTEYRVTTYRNMKRP